MWKKAGIILGHVICIFIILFSITYHQNVFGKENNDKMADVQGNPEAVTDVSQTPIPTEILEVKEKPTPTNTLTPTETPMLTNTPIPTVTPELIATNTPTPTVTPVSEPTPTNTPEPTVTPVSEPTPTNTPTPTVTPVPTVQPTQAPPVTDATDREAVKQWVLSNISAKVYSELDNNKEGWWFIRNTDQIPSGSGEQFDISEYQGYFRNKEVEDGDKVVYMTIDCGYGSANTPEMLDIFKKHDVKVMFFVTKYFIDSSPEYVRRMVEEGHMVGNHSVTHPNLTKLTDEEIYKEIIGCEEAFFEVTGKQMDLYFRPPEGAYSKRTMQITEDLGYKTIFWSIAYNDYDKNNQPGKAYVIDHFNTYHHNGAIPLMHNDSQSNLEAMDDVLTFLKEQGYRFGTLDELK